MKLTTFRRMASKLGRQRRQVVDGAARYATFQSGAYNTGKSNDEVEDAASEDGSYGVGNPEITGDNAFLHFRDALVSGHRSARGVIGHEMRRMLQEIAATLSILLPRLKISRAAALFAIDAHTSAQKHALVLHEEHRVSGVALPKKRGWLHVVAFVLLFCGDWTLITTSFQLFGLSDHPWIPGLGFTDDLHIAAISAVAMLVVIAELLGSQVRGLMYDIRLRATRGMTPLIVNAAVGVLLFGFGIAALIGLAEMRSEYLVQNGIDATNGPFIVLQLGIFVAALGLGYVGSPDPEGMEWRDKLNESDTLVVETRKAQDTALTTYVGHVGQYNAGVHQLDTVTAQAGHHVLTDRHSVGVQDPMYRRRYLLSQSPDQIATNAIPTEGYDGLPDYTDTSLLAALTGVKPLPKFKQMSTATIEQHLGDARAEVERLRWRIDQKGIDALGLPEYDKPERQPIGDDELPTNDSPDPDEIPTDDLDEELIHLQKGEAEPGNPWDVPLLADDDGDAEAVDLPADGGEANVDGSVAKP